MEVLSPSGIPISSTLNMVAAGSSETLVTTYQTTRCLKPEIHNLNPHSVIGGQQFTSIKQKKYVVLHFIPHVFVRDTNFMEQKSSGESYSCSYNQNIPHVFFAPEDPLVLTRARHWSRS
jgi:hypothetical protein